MTKVLYVPLDERACNYEFPQKLARIAGDIQLLVPPVDKMGFHKTAADFEWIWHWIFEQAAQCEYAILSVDTLVYGNIINSRTHGFSREECAERLSQFRLLKQQFPQLKIHAFNLVARVAGYDSSHEDPDYWATQGRNIWRYTVLTDKNARGHASAQEQQELDSLTAAIPAPYLDDFLRRREVDRFTNLHCVDLVQEGVFDMLTIPKDDTAEYGYAAMDQAAVAQKVREGLLMDRVMVYPGADEVGSVLFARVFNLIHRYAPRVYVRYSSTLGPAIVPKYEDRPLHEGIKAQIASAGGILEDSAAQSDCMLAVNSPGTHMIESSEQYSKDISFSSHINTHEFLRYIRHYAEHYQKPLGLAEVSVCNGCENEFMWYAHKTGVLELADSVGGWNTAQNTIGVVLAQAMIASYYHTWPANPTRQRLMEEFTITSIVADWLYQSNVLHAFYMETKDRIDPYSLKGHYAQTVDYFKTRLGRLISERFAAGYRGKKIVINDLSFNWDGVFYIRLDVRLQDDPSLVP